MSRGIVFYYSEVCCVLLDHYRVAGLTGWEWEHSFVVCVFFSGHARSHDRFYYRNSVINLSSIHLFPQASMDLPPDKAKLLKNYDDERKWDIICDRVS